MDVLPLALQVLTFGAMVAVSAWGWKHVDPATRIHARAGTSGFDWTMSKKTALVMTPLIGLMILLGTLALRDSPPGRAPDQGAWLGLAVLVIFLLAHWSSIRRAGR